MIQNDNIHMIVAFTMIVTYFLLRIPPSIHMLLQLAAIHEKQKRRETFIPTSSNR
jgi:hypothetical protein